MPESVIGEPTSTEVRVQFVDHSGKSVPIQDVAVTHSDAIRLRLEGPQVILGSVPITLSLATEDPYSLVASIPDLRAAGTYTLTAVAGILRREYVTQPGTSKQVVFRRYDPLLPITYAILVIEVALIALLVFLILRAIILRINPITGTLEFSFARSSTQPVRIAGPLALTRYRRNTIILDQAVLRRVDSDLAAHVKRLKIKNATSGDPRASADDIGSVQAAVKIWGWDISNGEFMTGEEVLDQATSYLIENISVTYRK